MIKQLDEKVRHENESRMLDDVARMLLQNKPPSSEEIQKLLQNTLRKLGEAISAQVVVVMLADPTLKQARIQAAYFSPCVYGLDKVLRSRFVDLTRKLEGSVIPLMQESPAYQVLHKNQRVLKSEPEGFREFKSGAFSGLLILETVAAVPLVIDGRPVGCLEAFNKVKSGATKVSAFDEYDLNIMQGASGLLSRMLRCILEPGLPLSCDEKAECMARLAHCSFEHLGPDSAIDQKLIIEAGIENCRNFHVLPLSAFTNKEIKAAVSNPFDLGELSNFEVATGFKVIEKVVVSEQDLKLALERAGKSGPDMFTDASKIAQAYTELVPDEDVFIREDVNESSMPIMRLANQIIVEAHRQGASDIHIEPQEKNVIVRYRIDGVCRKRLTLPIQAARPLISRIKIMSSLDIAEHRLPQDGRLIFKKFNTQFDLDLRISIVPGNYGESAVMRLLDKRKSTLPLNNLGFSEYNLHRYRELLALPYGMVLHCGPTGSGKSLTLYAALNEINSPDWKIVTAEDPIEYTLPGLIQVQMNRSIGLTFASALRCFLRQDPDIILVGEIRDGETAEIATEAALTGHLLFSTLHTNDAASSVVRLTELGVEPFLVSSVLAGICSQRLMRRLCSCAHSAPPTESERKLLEHALDSQPLANIGSVVGCSKCEKTGYKGRTGIHELLTMDNDLRALISRGAATEEIKAMARKCGMRTLFEDAMEKVKTGVTSMAEAMSTVQSD